MPDWNPFAGTAGVMRRPPTLADLLGGGAAAGVGGFADNPSGAAIPSGPQPVLHDEDFGPAGGGMMAPMAPPSGPVPKELFTPPPAAQTGFNMTTPTGSVLQNVAPPEMSQTGQTIDFLRGQNKAQGLDLFAQPIPAGDPGGPGAGGGFNPEVIARRAQDIGDSSFNMNMGGFGGIPGAAAGANELSKNFLGLMASQQKNQGGLDVAKEQSRGHIAAAEIGSRSHQLAELDKADLHIQDSVNKGLMDKFGGQAMRDTINARRQNLMAAPGGAPGQAAPPGGGLSGLSPPLNAGADIAGLRSLFGSVDPSSGRFTPKEGLGGGDITALIDKLDPKQIPQIAAAMRGGQFGDPAAMKNAAYNSIAQNYLMSQGRLPGGAGQAPGQYTIPVGDKPLMDLISSPASNMADSVAKKAAFAQSGVPYDTIRLADGTQIPFDRSGVKGLSNMSASLGYNQSGLKQTGQRLTPLAQLIMELQQGK